jgi:single-strand DNA-binding protein
MIIGNLGRDPEMRYTPGGRAVATYTVACSRAWNNSEGERHEETEWFNVVAWGKLAETCKQYLIKGSLVYVEGRLQTRSWDDNDGKKHSRTELVANEMIILDRSKTAHASSGEAPIEPTTSNEPEDEFPF